MNNKDKYINAQKVNDKIQNKKRGEILYYSIDQVADLLNENISNIKYYTNIFDDLLKIEIVAKELRYTNSDVDKLEFLVKLKNKGLSLKEIQNYYNKLPLNDTEIECSASNLLSVEELIDSIKEAQRIQLDNFKAELINDIQNTNLLYLQNITSTILEVQNKSINKIKQDLSKEIKDLINSKFDNIYKINKSSHNELIINTTEFLSKKIDDKNDELKFNLQNDFNTFTQSSLTNNERLIKEVKDFKRVMHNAYYTQQQVDMDNANESFFNKLLQIIKPK